MDPSPLISSPVENNGQGVDLLEALLGHFSGRAVALEDLNPVVARELRASLEKGGFFGADMKHLWLMLEKVSLQSGAQPGISEKEFQLLNLACGRCEEGAILSAFFGRTGKKVCHFAMDLRDREIDEAKRRYAKTEELFRKAGVPAICREEEGNSVRFVADNALHLTGYGQVPREFDAVFIRHQNLWHDREIWEKIYEFALHRIKATQGLLIITSYFDREHLLALDLLRKLGGTVLCSVANPYTRALDNRGKSVDRHVAAIARIEPNKI